MSSKKKIIFLSVTIVVLLATLSTSIFAWFYMNKDVMFYAPISSPESLYIGAGHTELRGLYDPVEDRTATDDTFEDVRYLYFEGIDLTDGKESPYNYTDYVFCVFGRGIYSYKIQIAFTTNNGFEYELYHATETLNSEASGIATFHEVHTDTPKTYYYILGSQITGSYLNVDGGASELLALDDDTYYTNTYGTYENVDKYAVPLYWQTNSTISGSINGGFVHYYILRVIENAKNVNDKETDIVCISARAH